MLQSILGKSFGVAASRQNVALEKEGSWRRSAGTPLRLKGAKPGLMFGAILVIFAFLCVLCGRSHAADRPPDLVVFLSDDHGLLDSTPYGATDVRTPNLQRLANEGMLFTHVFIASPACAPSRSALLTGLMPARNGSEANHTFKRDGVRSLTENLVALGYDVAAFGKVAHGPDVARHGFTHTDNRYGVPVVEAYLDRRDTNKPLCLFVGTRDPHVPWAPNDGYDPARVKLPPTFVDTPETREFRAQYYTDVSIADRDLGGILDLARRKLGTNVFFLYTSDHGAQWPFGKWNLYDAGIRCPLIVAWPGVIPPGSRTGAMVQWIDLLPTLLELAGGSAPADIDGRSFADVLRGRRSEHRDVIFTTHSNDGRMNVYPIRALRTRDWKFILNLHPEFAHTTHIDLGSGAGDGWRYFREWVWAAETNAAAAAVVKRYHARPREELYDLSADPDELRNLARDPQHAARSRGDERPARPPG
jgi:N-sulfoglucosamine sulfohydrolase